MNPNGTEGSEDSRRTSLPETGSIKALVIVLAFAALSYYLCSNYFFVGFFNDDTVNISLARSILEGRGYRDIFIAGAPPHRQFPPGFPLMLVPFVALFPHAFVPMKILVIIFSLLSIAALYHLFREKLKPCMLPVFLILCAFNTVILHFSGTVLSDIPHYFFFLLFLSAAERSEIRWPGSGGAQKALLIAIPLVCFLLCISIRVFSFIILPSFLIYLVIKRFRNRKMLAGLLAAAALLLVLAWTAFSRFFTNYISYYALFTSSLANILCGNIAYYGVNLPAALIGEPAFLNQYAYSQGFVSFIAWFVILIILALTARGFVLSVKERLSLMDCVFAVGTLFILCWPHQDMRYFIPLYPFFYLYIIRSITKMDGYRPRRAGTGESAQAADPVRQGPALKPGFIFLMLIVAVQAVFLVRTVWLSRFAVTYNNTPPESAYLWIRNNTDKSDLIMSMRFATYLYTGRKLVPLDYGDGSSRQTVGTILSEKAGYVLYEQIPYEIVRGEGVGSQQVFHDILNMQKNKFSIVFSGDSAGRRIEIFKVDGRAADIFKAAQLFYDQGTKESLNGNLRKGAELFRRCIETDPYFIEARYNLAVNLERQGRTDEACTAYREIIDMAPFYQKPYLSMARLYDSIGQKDKATKLMEELRASQSR